MNYQELSNLTTPVLPPNFDFEDADEELRPIAEFIKKHTTHNEEIMPSRIKFAYSSKAKKEGGRYTLGALIIRQDFEKLIDDNYDYIAFIYYKVWKELDIENKVIQLDKILSCIDTGTMENPKFGKKNTDTREHSSNLNYYGSDKVLNSSSIVHMTCERIAEEEKETKRGSGKQKVSANDAE